MSVDSQARFMIDNNYYVQGRLRGEKIYGGYRIWRPLGDDSWVFDPCDFSEKDIDDLIALCQVFKNVKKEEWGC